MSRRYLQRPEVSAALSKGKVVECFLGHCERDGRYGIRRFEITSDGISISLCVYETEDYRNPEFLDLYEFGPLNPSLEFGDADENFQFVSLDECLAYLDVRWRGSGMRLVNGGVAQDEYADYLAALSN